MTEITAAEASEGGVAPAAPVEGGSEMPSSDPVRNSEEENALIDNQLREIEQETKQQALVSERRGIDTLVARYDPDNSVEFFIKATELSQRYSHMREVRRDGNCFYRAVLVAQVENMLHDPDECRRFNEVCRGWQDRLIKLGFAEFTTTDFCEVFYEFLDEVVKGKMGEEKAFELLNDDAQSNYLVIFLRLVASGYLKENSADFAPFIDGDRSLDEFCQTEIEPMWKDADHLAVTALVGAIGVRLRVEYLDQSAAPNGGVHYDFPPDSTGRIHAHLLYTPGHYDLLYLKKD